MHTRTLPDRDGTWTQDEASIVLEQWRQSGESIAGFARRHGVGPARLYWWKNRLAPTRLALVPAVVTAATASTSTAAVAIRLRDGIAIEIADASPSWVAAMVVELERSRS